jgi:hypothetical protein
MNKDENNQKHKKKAHVGHDQETKWEIPIQTRQALSSARTRWF